VPGGTPEQRGELTTPPCLRRLQAHPPATPGIPCTLLSQLASGFPESPGGGRNPAPPMQLTRTWRSLPFPLRPFPRALPVAVWMGLLLSGVVSGCLNAPARDVLEPSRAQPTIPDVVVDGAPGEWHRFAPVWKLDPATPPTPFENVPPGSGVPRPLALHLRGAPGFLYLLVELDRVVNLQSMEGTLRLVLDRDGDPSTGETVGGMEGVDLLVDFSHRTGEEGEGNRAGQGILARGAGEAGWRDSYGEDLLYAPTHASDHFEIRLAAPRAENPVRLRLLALDPAGGEIAATPILIHRHAGGGIARLRPGSAAIARAPGTELRVLAWNVGDRAMMRTPEPFLRILSALDPDVLLLDELNPAMDARWLLGILQGLPRGEEWRVVVGPGGGRQRTGVASRLPVEAHPGLERIPWPDSIRRLTGLPMSNQMQQDMAGAAEDHLPAVGAMILAGGTRFLLVPLDLMCCGRVGGPEDRARLMAADALRGAIAGALAQGGIDAVIVGGDLNLVGSATPLERLRTGLDPAGGSLLVVPTPRLDGASSTTWRNPGFFPPGRLDYLLVSGSKLEPLRSFAFAPDDLAPEAWKELGLQEGDWAASDHLPLVVDLRIRP